MKQSEDRLQKIKRSLENEELIELAIVYGSTARGDYRSDSDADIAIAGKELIPISKLAQIAARIELKTGI